MIDEEILELYEDRAIQAVRALRASWPRIRCWRRTAVPDLSCRRWTVAGAAPTSRRAATGRSACRSPSKEDGTLRFAVLTDRARAEATLQLTQRELIDAPGGRGGGAATEQKPIAVTLFELLIPNRLKEAAPDSRDLVLVVDKGSARYPWELLRDRMSPGDEPMAVLRARGAPALHRALPRARGHDAHLRRALVVGDPPSRFPPLPGAQRPRHGGQAPGERRLRGAASRSARTTATSSMRSMPGTTACCTWPPTACYEYEPPRPASRRREPRAACTGMVLGDDIFLTPVEIKQMRVVPELVFINCCFLGRIDEPLLGRERSGLAANLATAADRDGRACRGGRRLGSGRRGCGPVRRDVLSRRCWPGGRFGRALAGGAPAAPASSHPDVNTWGAYQGLWRPGLFASGPATAAVAAGGAARRGFVARGVRRWWRWKDICADAKTADAGAKPRPCSAAQVAELATRARCAHWRERRRSSVCCARGRRIGETGRV
ncbi:MAG: CHAT domain-containing protein [Comamonadaceae bacterium]|nr:CHAT domain-containing protein [Comamonadaceae bacterium]